MGQQIAPQREHLPELKKGEPQFLEGFPHLFRRRPIALAKQSSQELVSDKHAEDLHESRCRSQQAAFLWDIKCFHCHFILRLLRFVNDVRVRFDNELSFLELRYYSCETRGISVW